ncbi:MAG: hypothetical protein ACRC2R_12510 [Xenococcaceae cyanobacterium]
MGGDLRRSVYEGLDAAGKGIASFGEGVRKFPENIGNTWNKFWE